jgi:pyruvate dehydrogenase E1 component beta subunit
MFLQLAAISLCFSIIIAVLTSALQIVYSQQIEKEGKDVTITAFSKMVGYALKVCSVLQMF